MTPASESLVALTMIMKRIVGFLLLLGSVEQHLQIAPEMLKAFSGDLRPVFRLSQNEGALDHGLGVKPEALGAPRRVGSIAGLGFGNVLSDLGGMRADMRVAGFANGRMGLEGLLNHRAKQAGEFRQATLENRHPEIDVTQKALQGIMQSAIGSLCKTGCPPSPQNARRRRA